MRIFLLLILISLVSCDVDTGSVSLEDVAFTSYIYGEYKLTSDGATALNEEYFSTTTIDFSTSTLFCVDSSGTLSIWSSDFSLEFELELLYAIDSNDRYGVYEVISPSVDDSGTTLKDNRYVKVYVDSQTNLSLYTFTNTKSLAESSTDSYTFAYPSYSIY